MAAWVLLTVAFVFATAWAVTRQRFRETRVMVVEGEARAEHLHRRALTAEQQCDALRARLRMCEARNADPLQGRTS